MDTAPEEKSTQKPKPWGRGVSAADKERAEALLAKGNQLFVAGRHREALTQYRTALSSWDHPAIRFNIARTLIVLDKPVEAFDNIKRSLRYGKPPLGHLFDEAQNYQRLLENQIATLKVSCPQDGVTVAVDGRAFLSCPGKRSVRLLPGTHQVVGKKPGHLTFTRDVLVLAGKSDPVNVRLLSHEDAMVTVRRWDTWLPWTVAGAGVVLGGVGVLLELQAHASRSQYAELLAQNCGDTPCPPEFGDSTMNRAQLEHGFGIGSMIVGGTALALGITGVILNSPRKVLKDKAQGDIAIVPIFTSGGGSFTIVGSF